MISIMLKLNLKKRRFAVFVGDHYMMRFLFGTMTQWSISFLGGNGGPKRECRLTEEDYELIEAHEMKLFYSWERIMSKADEEALQKP